MSNVFLNQAPARKNTLRLLTRQRTRAHAPGRIYEEVELPAVLDWDQIPHLTGLRQICRKGAVWIDRVSTRVVAGEYRSAETDIEGPGKRAVGLKREGSCRRNRGVWIRLAKIAGE